MKHCPKCDSTRIRRGYAHDSFLVRMVGFRELLCDSCNLRFRGFVFPGTLPRSSHHKKRTEPVKTVAVRQSEEKPAPARPRSASKCCPTCSSMSTHRSHRHGIIENIVSLLKIYPYRCDDCNNRFLARRKRTAQELAHQVASAGPENHA